jgi:hypothetical protein
MVLNRFEVPPDGLRANIIVYAFEHEKGEAGVKEGVSVTIHDKCTNVSLRIAPHNTDSSFHISAKTIINVPRRQCCQCRFRCFCRCHFPSM